MSRSSDQLQLNSIWPKANIFKLFFDNKAEFQRYTLHVRIFYMQRKNSATYVHKEITHHIVAFLLDKIPSPLFCIAIHAVHSHILYTF